MKVFQDVSRLNPAGSTMILHGRFSRVRFALWSIVFFGFFFYSVPEDQALKREFGSRESSQGPAMVSLIPSDFSFSFFSSNPFEVGEELTYIVRYFAVNIGEVSLKITGKKNMGGIPQYDAAASINSYEGLPFVNLHADFFSTMTADPFSSYFKGIMKNDEYEGKTEYFFNYPQNKVRIVKGKVKPPETWVDSTMIIKNKFQDGLSLFYYARVNNGSTKKTSVFCFVNEEVFSTDFLFSNKIVPIEIKAFDYECASYYISGNTNFVGIFGLTGEFEGWFSADNSSVPLLAHLNVLIGAVSLELIKWKKGSWIPPKYRS